MTGDRLYGWFGISLCCCKKQETFGVIPCLPLTSPAWFTPFRNPLLLWLRRQRRPRPRRPCHAAAARRCDSSGLDGGFGREKGKGNACRHASQRRVRAPALRRAWTHTRNPCPFSFSLSLLLQILILILVLTTFLSLTLCFFFLFSLSLSASDMQWHWIRYPIVPDFLFLELHEIKRTARHAVSDRLEQQIRDLVCHTKTSLNVLVPQIYN